MRCWILLMFLIFLSVPVQAYEFEGTQTMAMGGAGRAIVSGNDALNLNPAGLAWAKLYSLEASARDDLRGTDTWINASIIDGQAGPIAGGISYTYIDRVAEDGSQTQLGHQVDLALATRLTETMAFGLTARYLKADENDGDSDYQLFTIDAGYQWKITSGLSLGVTASNITDTERSTAPVSFGGGLSYGADTFGLSADVRYNALADEPKYLFGLAYLLSAVFPVRAGVTYDAADESIFVAGGLGYQTKQFSVDLAYRQRVEDGINQSATTGDRQLGFSVRLTYF